MSRFDRSETANVTGPASITSSASGSDSPVLPDQPNHSPPRALRAASSATASPPALDLARSLGTGTRFDTTTSRPLRIAPSRPAPSAGEAPLPGRPFVGVLRRGRAPDRGTPVPCASTATAEGLPKSEGSASDGPGTGRLVIVRLNGRSSTWATRTGSQMFRMSARREGGEVDGAGLRPLPQDDAECGSGSDAMGRLRRARADPDRSAAEAVHHGESILVCEIVPDEERHPARIGCVLEEMRDRSALAGLGGEHLGDHL